MASPLEAPQGNWWDRAIGGYEKVWLWICLFWALLLFAWMVGWAMVGAQNPIGKTYKVKPEAFQSKVRSYMKEAEKTDRGFIPPGDDVYIAGMRYAWMGLPVVLEAGKQYDVHLGSIDVQHGFSVRKEDVLSKQMSLQVLPGYEWVVPMEFEEPGTYHVICNEFCGYGHRTMHASFRVVE